MGKTGGAFLEDFPIFLKVFSALIFLRKGKGAEGRNKKDAKSSKKDARVVGRQKW